MKLTDLLRMNMHESTELWTCEIAENNLSHRAFCNV